MGPGRLADWAPRLQSLIDEGLTLEAALDELRSDTGHPLEAIKALRNVTGVDIPSAMEILEGRPVWRELIAKVRKDTEAFFDALDGF